MSSYDVKIIFSYHINNVNDKYEAMEKAEELFAQKRTFTDYDIDTEISWEEEKEKYSKLINNAKTAIKALSNEISSRSNF